MPVGKVLHSCDYPPCVNPRHLREGDDSDNMRDMYSRARGGRQRLTPEAVRAIRERAALGEKHTSLAAEHGCAVSTINMAVERRTWGWVE